MTVLGWIFLVTSLTFVWSLTIWCFHRVLTFKDTTPDSLKRFHSA
jgi:hypothetical protein